LFFRTLTRRKRKAKPAQAQILFSNHLRNDTQYRLALAHVTPEMGTSHVISVSVWTESQIIKFESFQTFSTNLESSHCPWSGLYQSSQSNLWVNGISTDWSGT